jgi:4-deoxy-L-threo-5-hexosulose-uronate ketol-isomerase
MRQILAQHPEQAAVQPTDALRENYLLTGLFRPGESNLAWWETDRTIAGGICPTTAPLPLTPDATLRSDTFLARREAGIINLGGSGVVRVDGHAHTMAHRDGLYLGRGTGTVEFASADPAHPAKYWFLSYPAHAAHPMRHLARAAVSGDRLGATATANARTIYKYFHPGALPTCQLVMGLTVLEPGSVWNTMPPHTHLRRSEVYLYFDLPSDQLVFHLMGEPARTRHLVIRNEEAVLSPPWSVHCGAGTVNYGFIWGMGGENQEFADMDPVALPAMR